MTVTVAIAGDGTPDRTSEALMPASPMVEITYCRLCGWGLRAGWMAQELLATFAAEVGSVALTPDASGGVFEVRVDGDRRGSDPQGPRLHVPNKFGRWRPSCSAGATPPGLVHESAPRPSQALWRAV